MTAKARKPVTLRVVRLPHAAGLPLPAYETDGAAGLDLLAAVEEDAPLMLKPGQSVLVPTGLVLAVPGGHELQVRPRSGLALKHGVTVLNSPGTIDSDYRGEVGVLLVNFGRKLFRIHRGERIAQAILAPVARAEIVAVARLETTRRGAGGFGSTGLASGPERAKPVKQAAGNRSPQKKAAKKNPVPRNHRGAKRSKAAKPR